MLNWFPLGTYVVDAFLLYLLKLTSSSIPSLVKRGKSCLVIVCKVEKEVTVPKNCEGTHRFDEPVSNTTVNVCFVEPILFEKNREFKIRPLKL